MIKDYKHLDKTIKSTSSSNIKKLEQAKEYLGDKWLLSPANSVKRLTTPLKY